MRTKCIQFKFKDNIIKIEGVDLDTTSSLLNIIKSINYVSKEDVFKQIENALSQIEENAEEAWDNLDYTNIAENTAGNTSLAILRNMSRLTGSPWTEDIENITSILNFIGYNIMSNDFLITNSATPLSIYIGNERSLIELGKDYKPNNILEALVFLYTNHQVKNVYSNFYQKLLEVKDEYIKKYSKLKDDPTFNLEDDPNFNMLNLLSKLPNNIAQISQMIYHFKELPNDIQTAIKTIVNEDIQNQENKSQLKDKYFNNSHLHSLLKIENEPINLGNGNSINTFSLLEIRKIFDTIDTSSVSINWNDKRFEEGQYKRFKDIFKNKFFGDGEVIRMLNSFEQKMLMLYTQEGDFKYIESESIFNVDDLINVFEYILKNVNVEDYRNKKFKFKEGASTILSNLILPKSDFTNLKDFKSNIDFNFNINFNVDNFLRITPNAALRFYGNIREFDKISKDSGYIFKLNLENVRDVTGDKNITNLINYLKGKHNLISDIRNKREDNSIIAITELIYTPLKKLGYDLVKEFTNAGFRVNIYSDNWKFDNKFLSQSEFIKKFDVKENSFDIPFYSSSDQLNFKYISEDHFNLIKSGEITKIITNYGAFAKQPLNKPFRLKSNNKGMTGENLIIIKNKEYLDDILNSQDPDELKELKEKSGLTLESIENSQDKNNIVYSIEVLPDNHTPVNKQTIPNFKVDEVLEQIILNMGIDIVNFTQKENNVNGYVKDGIIYINLASSANRNETLIHELSHLLFAGLKIENQDMYLELLKHVNKEDVDELKNIKKYQGLSEIDLREEHLIKVFSEFIQDQIINNKEYLKILEKMDFGKLLKTIFKLKENVDDTNAILANKTIESLLYTYGSDYNNLFKNIFATDNYILEMRLSNLKQDLIKNGILKEECK